MDINIIKKIRKERRAKRTRAKITGTAQRPRLSIFKSNTGFYAQLINDEANKTLVSAHSKQLKKKTTKMEASAELGKMLAEKAITAGIKQVVFDRGSNLYHGRVKAFADGARAAGLEF